MLRIDDPASALRFMEGCSSSIATLQIALLEARDTEDRLPSGTLFLGYPRVGMPVIGRIVPPKDREETVQSLALDRLGARLSELFAFNCPEGERGGFSMNNIVALLSESAFEKIKEVMVHNAERSETSQETGQGPSDPLLHGPATSEDGPSSWSLSRGLRPRAGKA